ncbi:MAG: ATP-binding cassette domain-containing protein [Candidatus Krumholzibacteria bacterium]|nr:ATP-binding cassette domain-containing protein [Candidatus Krumholzibacteria bacterium]MDH4338170.1 ATP-binding cassette domain-containing protein [Candidatus Krumholzibacteria bacterium]MDH5269841.1 ATP-binding cassette domain-containing protein [Candidatus Krumholzibacteria bacterium]
MTAPLISLRDAVVSYQAQARPALDGVSIDIAPGSWTAVSGANGSGKSTLLAVLAGLLPLRAGGMERAARRVAMLMQDPDDQLVASSVAHELELSVDPAEPSRAVRIAEATERFDLAPVLERNPHRLSGGEKQRLAMATVWLENPDVLLLDEPLAYLDAENRSRVLGFVRELNAAGAAVVWATPGEDVALARDAIVLEDGRACYQGPPAGVPAGGVVDAGPAANGAARPAAAPGSPAALQMQGVTFAYGDVPVLSDLNLEVAVGECVGVFGPNSSGKSTLLLVAGGAMRPAAGRVVRAGSAALYLPQSPERLFFAETVREEIAFGLRRRGIAAADIEGRAAESLGACGLDPAGFLDRSPFQLSFGEMRRVAFAIAHSLSPALLLLDEPASCLDASGRRVLRTLIDGCVAAGGAAVVASHDMTHLQGVGGRIVSLTQPQPADSIPANTPTRRL